MCGLTQPEDIRMLYLRRFFGPNPDPHVYTTHVVGEPDPKAITWTGELRKDGIRFGAWEVGSISGLVAASQAAREKP